MASDRPNWHLYVPERTRMRMHAFCCHEQLPLEQLPLRTPGCSGGAWHTWRSSLQASGGAKELSNAFRVFWHVFLMPIRVILVVSYFIIVHPNSSYWWNKHMLKWCFPMSNSQVVNRLTFIRCRHYFTRPWETHGNPKFLDAKIDGNSAGTMMEWLAAGESRRLQELQLDVCTCPHLNTIH